MLEPKEALLKILQYVTPVQETEHLTLRGSLGRVIAQDVYSPKDLPDFKSSAMDGFAVLFADLVESRSLQLIGASYAGRPFLGACKTGECVRIMTGALVPWGADTVVMQEHTVVDSNGVRVLKPYSLGANIRHPGEDVRVGDLVIQKGILLQPAYLGLLAGMGVATVEVFRLPKVSTFSTGDELVSLGKPLKLGQIYDSNRYALYGLIKAQGITPVDVGVLPDDKKEIRKQLIAMSESSDLVITSGGVSVGSADYVKEVLETIGEVFFWKVALKPGKPLAFGKIGRAYFFGLPGNPVSAMVTFDQFVRPALYALMGRRGSFPLQVKLRLAQDLKKEPGRVDIQRGIISRNQEGTLMVTSAGSQSSAALKVMSRANCYMVLPKDASNISAGEWVIVEPFDTDLNQPLHS